MWRLFGDGSVVVTVDRREDVVESDDAPQTGTRRVSIVLPELPWGSG